MAIGVIGYKDNGTQTYGDYARKTRFVSKNGWTKLYVSLGKEMIALKQANGTNKYQIVLYAKRNSSPTSEVNVDNVKILYY